MTTFKRSDPFPFEFEIHSTARRGAAHIYAKDGTERPVPLYPAAFDGKALKLASDCPVHPKYQALRPPRSKVAGCVCAEIYQQQEERG